MKTKYGHIIIMAIAIFIAAACDHDSDKESGNGVPVTKPGTPIVFNGQQSGELTVTRTNTPLSDAGITTFNVWGYKNDSYDVGTTSYSSVQNVFPGYFVDWTRNSEATTTTNSDGWEYIIPEKPEQTIKFWDWAAKAYRYFAVTNWGGESAGPYQANKAYGANGTYGASSYTTYEITMEVDVTSRSAIENMPYFSQLWFSTGNKVDYPTQEFGKPVQLVFMKPYSKVRIMYTYAYDSEGILVENQIFKPTADYEAVAPTGIARKGTFTISYPLTGTATKEWYTITPNSTDKLEAFLEDYAPNDQSKEYIDSNDGWYSVFPNTTQGSYKLVVTINQTQKTCIVPAEYMRWQPGYSYTYVFKINEQGGVSIDMVQVASNNWTELEGTHEVYNW